MKSEEAPPAFFKREKSSTAWRELPVLLVLPEPFLAKIESLAKRFETDPYRMLEIVCTGGFGIVETAAQNPKLAETLGLEKRH